MEQTGIPTERECVCKYNIQSRRNATSGSSDAVKVPRVQASTVDLARHRFCYGCGASGSSRRHAAVPCHCPKPGSVATANETAKAVPKVKVESRRGGWTGAKWYGMLCLRAANAKSTRRRGGITRGRDVSLA